MTIGRTAVAVAGNSRSLSFKLPDGDRGTAATIAIMRALVHDAAERRDFRAGIVQLAPFTAGPGDLADRLNAWLIRHFRFQRDAGGIEHVRQPLRMLRDFQVSASRTIAGDCDDLAVFACAALTVAGYRCAFVTVGRRVDGPYQHVHYAIDRNNAWMPYDPQERIPPGSWTPGRRRRLWPV